MHIVHLKQDGTIDERFWGGVLGIFFDRELGGNKENDFIESLDFAAATSGGTTV